ncbi:WD repeat-containing protein 1, partial [Spiromyces aspiralis]
MRGYSTRISASPKFDGLFAYPNGKNIIDESKTFEYTGHSHQTTVTRISPSGYYGASGDKSGTVHIWDTTKPEHETVHQYKLLGGAVKDLDWDADSKRLIVVGEGAGGSNAAVIMFDSGNTVGHITGHAKAINACSFRSKRPYRAVTGGEDMKAVLHEGPPFKFCNSTDGDHTGFVNDVRFSPNGEWFVTVSADRRIFMYEAKSGSRVREISGSDAESNGHRGAINAVSWSPGSKLIATSSSDGTVKIWDVESGRLVRTINLSKPTVSLSSGSNAVEQQQVGNCWVNEKSI